MWLYVRVLSLVSYGVMVRPLVKLPRRLTGNPKPHTELSLELFLLHMATVFTASLKWLTLRCWQVTRCGPEVVWSVQYKSCRLNLASGRYCSLSSDPLRSLFIGSGASSTYGSISVNTVYLTVKCHISRRDNPTSNS